MSKQQYSALFTVKNLLILTGKNISIGNCLPPPAELYVI
jgi:hypothetical protein